MQTVTDETPDSNIPTPQSNQRRFQFTLRSLLIGVTLLATFLGLYLRFVYEPQERVAREQAAIYEIKKLGGKVDYLVPRPVLASLPTWLSKFLGDEEYKPVNGVVFHHPQITARDLQILSSFTELESLIINHAKFETDCFQSLNQLNNLQTLLLHETPVSDGDLQYFSKMTELKYLFINKSQITDAGLKHLRPLKNLRSLLLPNSQITDAGLEHLCQLSLLIELNLYGTHITESGYANLRAALPNCKIFNGKNNRILFDN
jgi:hypothetical protein